MGIKPKTSIMLVGRTLGGLVPQCLEYSANIVQWLEYSAKIVQWLEYSANIVQWLEHSFNNVQWLEYSANIVQIVGSTPTWNAENLLSTLLTSGCIFL